MEIKKSGKESDIPRPYGCKCQTLRERALGDGCDECNKALVIEMLTDERDELQAEVERLEKELERAIYGCGCDNYLQIYCDKHNPYNKTK